MVDDRYELGVLLGQGGFGSVWRATDSQSGRVVAVKLLTATFDGSAERRFKLEAQALGQIQHPNCVTLFDFGRTPEGQFYLVTELVDGIPLDDWADQHRGDLPRLVDVARQITSALDALHVAGIVHRDLKPANILVSRTQDGGDLVKVLDFGLVKLTGLEQPDITKTGEVFGTPGYMSPEQLRGQRDVGTSTDLYALGVILFEMLEGRPVFEGESALERAMLHLMNEPPAVQREVPPRLRRLVAQLLNKDPAQRPRSAKTVMAELVRYDQPLDEPARPTLREPPRSEHPRSRPPITTIAVGAIGLLGVLAAVGFATRGDEPVAPPPGALERAQMRSTDLNLNPLRPPEPEEPEEPETPAGTTNAEMNAPCEGLVRYEAGRKTFTRFTGITRREMATRLPRGYDPEKRYPVLLAFHDGLQSPKEVIKMVMGMAPDALNEYVIFAPSHEAVLNMWENKSERRRALDDLQFLTTKLCIDPKQVFAFGHGAGGNAAEMIQCEYDGVVAAASSSHRIGNGDGTCDEPKVPYLFMTPTKDPVVPVDGKRDCLGDEKWALKKHVDHLKHAHGCGPDDPTVRPPLKAGRCLDFACDIPLRWCSIEGGRHWPSAETNNLVKKSGICFSEPAAFPYGEVLFEFFEDARSKAQ